MFFVAQRTHIEWLHEIFKESPEIALFLSLGLGHCVGKLKLRKFQLGGVTGSLLVAVIVSQVGVQIDPGVKAVLFALFIYAVGYESGPQFFRSLGKQSFKEIILAAVLALTGLATVLVMAKLFSLDKGLVAGIAAGSLTQSGIIGTAGEAISKLNLAADEIKRLQGNVAIGYAVTYVFGSFGAIVMCVNVLPKLFGRSIREDALKAEIAMQAGVPIFAPGQEAATPALVGRLYQIAQGNVTIAAIENANPATTITIERVKRDGKIIEVSPQLVLQANDIVLLVGRRDAVVANAARLGKEVYLVDDMGLTMQRRDMVMTNHDFNNKTVNEIRAKTADGVWHGIFVVRISRMGQPIPMSPATVVQLGDVVSIYGAEQDVKRVTDLIGYVIVPTAKTDFIYLGAGLVVGLLVGLLTVRIGSIPVTLGSGGGALLSGLLFGWYRAKRHSFGAMPNGSMQILKDLWLAGFVVVVGLNSGLQAVQTIRQHGMTIFGIGVVVTIVPLMFTMLIGRYVLGYDNVAVFAGALSGSRSANPAFGEVLTQAENSIPTVPFAITYALANVFLTLLGPLIVAFV